MSGEWQDYHLASKSTTEFRQNAARDLRVIYMRTDVVRLEVVGIEKIVGAR